MLDAESLASVRSSMLLRVRHSSKGKGIREGPGPIAKKRHSISILLIRSLSIWSRPGPKQGKDIVQHNRRGLDNT